MQSFCSAVTGKRTKRSGPLGPETLLSHPPVSVLPPQTLQLSRGANDGTQFISKEKG